MRPALSFAALAALGLAAAAGRADAQASPPIPYSWVIGEPIARDSPPTHFALGPSTPGGIVVVVARSRVLPNVLAALAGDSADPENPATLYRAGSQWFQLARQASPTFCSLEPMDRRRNFHCLIDTDGDGLLDSLVRTPSSTPAIPILRIDLGRAVRLARPVAARALPREEAAGDRNITLNYIGRRSMTRRDAGFMVIVYNGRDFSPGVPVTLDLNALPPEAVVAGVRLANLARRDKIIEFDVPSGFGRIPYEPTYIGHYTEWGF